MYVTKASMTAYSQTCIIDDDAIAVFGLKRTMATIGFTANLSIFENGLDALENFGQLLEDGSDLPTLIFIDLNMPVLDGWGFMDEFTKLLPTEKKRPKIFIMTSSIDVRDIEKAKTFGLEANYLIKPVSVDDLHGILV